MGKSGAEKMAQSTTILVLLCAVLLVRPGAAQTNSASAPAIEFDVTPEAAAEFARDDMESMDANKDGKVTFDEIKAYVKADFYGEEDVADSTEGATGGPPTPEEVVVLVQKEAIELFEDLDKNKDGIVTFEELRAQYEFNPDASDDEEDVDDTSSYDNDDMSGSDGSIAPRKSTTRMTILSPKMMS